MTNFVWPSDIDRAENDELNRVCEYLEEVLAFRSAVTGWRENDWPEWFCRRTAEAVADRGRQAEGGEA